MGKRKNKISADGILSSSTPDEKVRLDPVSGSLYIEIQKVINAKLTQRGDWTWLIDGTGIQEDMMASEFEPKVKR